MCSCRKQALQISLYLDQLLQNIQKVRQGMYEMAEIPHLFNPDNYSLDQDLKQIGEAQQYINNNVSTELSIELTLGLDENIKIFDQYKDQIQIIILSLEKVFSNMKNTQFEQRLQDKIYHQLLILSNVLNV